MNWIDLTDFGISCAGLIVAIIGYILTITSSYMERISRRFFKIFFILLIIYISSNLTEQISLTMLGYNYAFLSRTALFSESLFSSPC